MSILTPWGYTITDAYALEPMLSEAEFNALTANKYAGDARIEPNLAAACAAIRNWCGWHVYPAMACQLTERLLAGNGRVKRVGPDLLIQLPATFVSVPASVTIDGAPFDDYDIEPNGILRLFDVGHLGRKAQVTVTYTAGLPDGMMDGIKELIAGRVNHALAQPYGVQSESAGGVSVTYSASWAASASASALPDDNKDVLAPFKVRGVF